MLDINKLKAEQLRLAKKIITAGNPEVRRIAGVGQAFHKNKIISVIVICDYNTMEIIEKKYAIFDSIMPYTPTYMFYREGLAAVETFHKLERDFDVLLVDGNGILHPRRIGVASQLGLIIDKPTIGIAKSLLCGEARENTVYVGKEARAIILKTREHARPLYVSPGHLISLKASIEIVKKCIIPPHKLPEPIHLAHRYAKKVLETHFSEKPAKGEEKKDDKEQGDEDVNLTHCSAKSFKLD